MILNQFFAWLDEWTGLSKIFCMLLGRWMFHGLAAMTTLTKLFFSLKSGENSTATAPATTSIAATYRHAASLLHSARTKHWPARKRVRPARKMQLARSAKGEPARHGRGVLPSCQALCSAPTQSD